VRRGNGCVVFYERNHATGLVIEEDRVVGARVSTPGGTERVIRARVVVGADGRASGVAKWTGAASYLEVPPLRPIYYGYFSNVTPLFEPMLEQFYIDDRIGFVFPMQPGLDCLALEIQPEEFEAFRHDPAQRFIERFRTFPGMRTRLSDAILSGKISGIRGIPNHFRVPFGHGWALSGDAGYLRDPLTGTGMSDALNQSIWLADALHDAFQGADWQERLGEYHRFRDEMLMPGYEITLESVRRRDLPREELAWVEAALCSPAFARILATRLPPLIQDILPDNLRPRVTMLAQEFGKRAI
jgi:flavin-dependent dehydrogenase